jgi:hypothetical protein
VSSISFDFTTTGHETDLKLSIVDLGVVGDRVSATLDNALTPLVTTSLVSPVDILTPARFALENTTGTDVFVNIGTRRAPINIPCDYANLAGPYANLAGQCASAARAASYNFVSFFPLDSIRAGSHTLTLQLTQTDLVNGLPKGSYGLLCLNPDGVEHCGSPVSIPVPSRPAAPCCSPVWPRSARSRAGAGWTPDRPATPCKSPKPRRRPRPDRKGHLGCLFLSPGLPRAGVGAAGYTAGRPARQRPARRMTRTQPSACPV